MINSTAANKRILVTEDEPDILNLISGALRRAGFSVLSAEDGLSAVQMAREQRPALIVIDATLPGISGVEACQTLKKDPGTSEVPIIMLADAEQLIRIAPPELGADTCMAKPFSPRELVLRIKSLLGGPPVPSWLGTSAWPPSISPFPSHRFDPPGLS
jgi:DNA-binding response OmpR family regulator